MPVSPKGSESKQDFVSRCISEEVKSGYEQDQAAAICYSKWREAQKSKVGQSMKALQKSIKKVDVRAMKSEEADQITEIAEKAAELSKIARDVLTASPTVDIKEEFDYGVSHEMEKGKTYFEAAKIAVANLEADSLFYKSVRAYKQLAGQAGASIYSEQEEDADSQEESEEEAGVLKEGATSDSHGALIPEKLVGDEKKKKPKKK